MKQRSDCRIYYWIYKKELFTTVVISEKGVVAVYDSINRKVLQRTGLNKCHINEIENTIKKYGLRPKVTLLSLLGE